MSELFRIVLFCEDKRLPALLRAVTGLASAAPEVQPVVNAELSNGKVQASTNGKSAEMFLHYLKQHRISEFPAKDGQKICKAVGLSPGSSSYVLNRLVARHALKRTGKSAATRYTVVK